MTGLEIIDYIKRNKLENESMYEISLNFQVKLNDGTWLDYIKDDFKELITRYELKKTNDEEEEIEVHFIKILTEKEALEQRNK